MADDKLVDPELILEIPGTKNNYNFIHVGGVLAIGPDNNLYLSTGDGKGCQDYASYLQSVQKGPLGIETANMQHGAKANGLGGILRVTIEGQPVDKRGILGDEYPLNLYYAYGIRNSFGLDFDPVTGNLWDTENGPTFGDEINLVEAGFNSGWAKIQGVWTITDYSLIKPSSGSQRGYPVSESEQHPIGNNLVDFDKKGKYSEPEFTWNQTIGVTAIKFLSSDRLGEEYENEIFVGTFNQEGTIYHFDLKDDRKGIVLKGSLKDKIAGNGEELRQVTFAGGFGAISDLEVGPDGNLYVLSISKGKIYKISRND